MSDGRIERLIGLSRFPLICMVVLGHSLPVTSAPAKLNVLSAENLFNFVNQICHNFAWLTISLFVFFSGYFFFRGIESFSWKWCADKWKKRIHSLLIPFVLWNLLAVFAKIVKNYVFGFWGRVDADEMAYVAWDRMLDWFRDPADFPLWYIEDLMFMVLMAPVIWYIVKKLGRLSLILLLIVYLLPFDTMHVSKQAIVFFCIGAYCSIMKTDVYRFCRDVRIPSHVLAVCMLYISACYNTPEGHDLYVRIFIPFGAVSFINILDGLITKHMQLEKRLHYLAASSFFIYAIHIIYVLGWTKGFFLRLFGESLPAMFITLFITPVMVVAVCQSLFLLLRKIMPKALSVLCGGRIS